MRKFMFIIALLGIVIMSAGCLPQDKTIEYRTTDGHGTKHLFASAQRIEDEGWQDVAEAWCINPDAKSKGYVWYKVTYRQALTESALCCPKALTTPQEPRVKINADCTINKEGK